MARIVKITGAEGEPLWINPDQVLLVAAINDLRNPSITPPEDAHSFVRLVGDVYVFSEDPAEVTVDALRDSMSR